MELTISGIPIRGVEIDGRTSCVHYRSELDIICHELEAGHPHRTWPKAQFDEKAVLCGACGAELTILQYLNCQEACPACGARFNPRCELHYHLYFEMPAAPDSGVWGF